MRQLSLRYFFDFRTLSLKNFKGGLTALAHVANGGAGSVYLMIIVSTAVCTLVASPMLSLPLSTRNETNIYTVRNVWRTARVFRAALNLQCIGC